MRVAFVSTSYPVADLPIDGIGKAISLIARAAASEHDVAVIVANKRFTKPATYRDGPVLVHGVPTPETLLFRILGKRHRWLLAERCRSAAAVDRAVRDLGPFDVVEAPSWFGLHAFLGLRRKGRRPRLVTLLVTPLRVAMRSSSAHVTPEMRLADRFDQFATRCSDVLIADSELHRQHLANLRWIRRSDDVTVIPLPASVPPEDVASLPSAPGELLQVGVLDERKRQDLSVRALALLVPEFPDLHLVLVCPNQRGDESSCSKPNLQALSASLGVEVCFLDGLTEAELLARYQRAAVVLQPSEYESFGLPVAEAMAMGRPVVTTARTGASEWVTGVSGTVITAADPRTLAAAIRPYLRDPALRIEAGRAGRSVAEGEFAPAQVWAKRLVLYRSLVNGRERTP